MCSAKVVKSRKTLTLQQKVDIIGDCRDNRKHHEVAAKFGVAKIVAMQSAQFKAPETLCALFAICACTASLIAIRTFRAGLALWKTALQQSRFQKRASPRSATFSSRWLVAALFHIQLLLRLWLNAHCYHGKLMCHRRCATSLLLHITMKVSAQCANKLATVLTSAKSAIYLCMQFAEILAYICSLRMLDSVISLTLYACNVYVTPICYACRNKY